MNLKEKLKERLKNEYGITTDEQLISAVSEITLDLGIFITPIERMDQACEKVS